MATYNEEIPLKQKLKIADAYIRQLKGEIGMLESEKEELEDELNAVRNELLDLQHHVTNRKMSTGEKNSVRKQLFEKQVIKEYKTMKSRIEQLKKDNERLIIKLNTKK